MLAENLQFHSPNGYLNNPSIATASDGQPYYPTGRGYWATGENIFAYSGNVNSTSLSAYVEYFAASFLIDWGNPDFGHLTNELAPGPGQWNSGASHFPYSEIGIGLLTNVSPTNPSNSGLSVGPAIVTQEFGWRAGNPILTGAFYHDTNGTGQYSIGEGMGGVTIVAVGRNGQGTFSATTWNSGGYSLPLPSGTYEVTASGGGLASPISATVSLRQDNVEWDNSATSVSTNANQSGQSVAGNGPGTGHVGVPVIGPYSPPRLVDTSRVGHGLASRPETAPRNLARRTLAAIDASNSWRAFRWLRFQRWEAYLQIHHRHWR